MSIRKQISDISNLKLGNTDVQKVYKGTDLIWQKNSGIYTAFEMADGVENGYPQVCSISTINTTTYYHDGTGTYPTLGDTVYVTSNSGAFVGGNAWYLTGNGQFGMQIDVSGEVIAINGCWL